MDQDSGGPVEACVAALYARRTRGSDNEGVISFAAADVEKCGVDVLLDDKAAQEGKRRLGQGSKVKCLQQCRRVESVAS